MAAVAQARPRICPPPAPRPILSNAGLVKSLLMRHAADSAAATGPRGRMRRRRRRGHHRRRIPPEHPGRWACRPRCQPGLVAVHQPAGRSAVRRHQALRPVGCLFRFRHHGTQHVTKRETLCPTPMIHSVLTTAVRPDLDQHVALAARRSAICRREHLTRSVSHRAQQQRRATVGGTTRHRRR